MGARGSGQAPPLVSKSPAVDPDFVPVFDFDRLLQLARNGRAPVTDRIRGWRIRLATGVGGRWRARWTEKKVEQSANFEVRGSPGGAHASGPERIGAGVPPTSGIVHCLAQPRRRLGGADRVAPQAPGKTRVKPVRMPGGAGGAILPVCAARDNAADGLVSRVLFTARSATRIPSIVNAPFAFPRAQLPPTPVANRIQGRHLPPFHQTHESAMMFSTEGRTKGVNHGCWHQGTDGRGF
jgi:hypothetical protein